MRQVFAGVLAILVVGCASTTTPPTKKASFLYVQTAGSGSFVPLPGRADRYRLLLNDVSPSVVYFSDRPNRLAGHIATGDFLQVIGFGGALDPNAAIDLQGGSHDQDLIVAALSAPAYDPQSATLSYELTILDTPREGLAVFSQRMDKRLPERFGAVALFIDDSTCRQPWCRPQANISCCPGWWCQTGTDGKPCMAPGED